MDASRLYTRLGCVPHALRSGVCISSLYTKSARCIHSELPIAEPHLKSDRKEEKEKEREKEQREVSDRQTSSRRSTAALDAPDRLSASSSKSPRDVATALTRDKSHVEHTPDRPERVAPLVVSSQVARDLTSNSSPIVTTLSQFIAALPKALDSYCGRQTVTGVRLPGHGSRAGSVSDSAVSQPPLSEATSPCDSDERTIEIAHP